jgi:hypothetical protein
MLRINGGAMTNEGRIEKLSQDLSDAAVHLTEEEVANAILLAFPEEDQLDAIVGAIDEYLEYKKNGDISNS